jgi:hypothetical protein
LLLHVYRILDVNSKPKYSVIIPAKNGMPYLKYAVLSALSSDFLGLEVIVSLDGSMDESEKFLSEIQDSRLRVVRPDHGLSMSEHWDFAQLQASGDWQLFLGQDDLLMSGYARAFEFLTQEAGDRNLDVVVARRAYVTWPPLGSAKLKALQYWESGELEVRDAETFAATALTSNISYHAGPQMYTTSLVSEKLISQIRLAHSGRLVLGHPQDAYLAAALLREGRNFLFSGRPFSLVGTSTRSAGLAISLSSQDAETNSLSGEYLQSVSNSVDLAYKSSVDFRHAVNSRYFIDALAVVWPEILESKKFKSALFRILVDSHSWSVLAQNRKEGIALKDIFYFRGLGKVKELVGLVWIVGAGALSFTRRIGAIILSRISPRNLKFSSVDHVEDVDELFAIANAIPINYNLRDSQ